MHPKEKIRNVAIVAHIDHGKTTLIDILLRQTKVFRENEEVDERIMDSFDLEKERGITIFSKHTSLVFEEYKINLIDTPGHADFSGEVERVLGMVNSVLLLVDAQEGPMPQTRFVLAQALKQNLKPIVVLNKIDRPHADVERTLNETFDLFVELGATDEQLDFAYCYASGIGGYAKLQIDDPEVDMRPLFELIIDAVPAPTGSSDAPFIMQAATLHYSEFLGRAATGRVTQGSVSKGADVNWINADGQVVRKKITRIEGYHGIKKVELECASVGDIVSLSGIPDVMIGDTIADISITEGLPAIPLGRPTLSIDILANSGPLVGMDGKHVTFNKIRDRLWKEKRANISLVIEEVEGREDIICVKGRGELHLSILLETMRREGFECLVSKPRVITQEIDNKLCEPFERVHIEVPECFAGGVIEEVSKRGGEMQHLETSEHGLSKIEFLAPTRALLGYRALFINQTRGEGVLTAIFDSFQPHKGKLMGRQKGVLISNAKGKATPYSLFNLQDRGVLFIDATTQVYEGMIVGEHAKANDLVVNPVKEKQLTNVRASGSDENVILTPPLRLTLEQAINFIESDELVEITPNYIRLRKAILKESDRKRSRV